ncbi:MULTISPECIES: YraN family protein [Clostridium]|uniref:YraN family protein n=1 Tax=Clostridium TaxID=1485 RepID=UPI00082468DC|nr:MULTISPECIES: YraN family protein [Clostridium]PJI06604.1 YraN family protein [Clostridium sp. CT7]
MHNLNKKVGDYGEKIAVLYLKKLGYIIRNKNYRCRLGELDIIAQDKSCIMFTEVKARYNDTYGFPVEAVNRRKRLKIYNTAKYYISDKRLSNYNFRFDVIEIVFNYQDDSYELNFIPNAF